MKNNPGGHIGISGSTNVHIYNVTLHTPGSGDKNTPSRWTDGIDMGDSVNVLVENCSISVGKCTKLKATICWVSWCSGLVR